jgi:hypothetical protein
VRGAGLSAEVGELDEVEGSTTAAVLDGVEGSTTMAVLNGVEGNTTMKVLDGVEGSTTTALLDGVEGMTTYETCSTLTKSTMKHKNGSILSKSSMCELDLTHLHTDL